MNILIINDKLFCGGTEVQCLKEKQILEAKGHKVSYLTFDSEFPYEDDNFSHKYGFYNISVKDRGIKKIYRKLFTDFKIMNRAKKIIRNINPDIIHVNNLYLAPRAQYKSLVGYKCVQTIRDYSAICPLLKCIDKNSEICEGYKFNNCNKECRGVSKILPFKYFNTININNLKSKYILKYISPSEKLNEICINNGYKEVVTINDVFTMDNIEDFCIPLEDGPKKYIYIGGVDDKKGIFRLVNVFKKFEKDKNVELTIIGSGDYDKVQQLENIISDNKKIKYAGRLDHSRVINLLKTSYSVVVPSICMDNYPNTVIEGMATSNLVIGSNRGGIEEMLADGRGIIFDINKEESFLNALEYSYNINHDEYLEIAKKSREYVLTNNSISTYYNKIINIFNMCLEDSIQ